MDLRQPVLEKGRSIVHRSKPQAVSMADEWFEIADLSHFWMVRRFEVLQRLAGHLWDRDLNYCEIGCGQGILQQQLENEGGLSVDGFDLCLSALEQNRSQAGTLYYYDVTERRAEFREKYDGVFLFDVLEHLKDDVSFLKAAMFHLKPGGYLFVHVPARRELFSAYDSWVGHVRRYSLGQLHALAQACELEPQHLTYWGLPLYPLLLVRKVMMAVVTKPSGYEKGMRPPGRLANSALRQLSRLEIVPQQVLGTSLLGVLRKS